MYEKNQREHTVAVGFVAPHRKPRRKPSEISFLEWSSMNSVNRGKSDPDAIRNPGVRGFSSRAADQDGLTARASLALSAACVSTSVLLHEIDWFFHDPLPPNSKIFRNYFQKEWFWKEMSYFYPVVSSSRKKWSHNRNLDYGSEEEKQAQWMRVSWECRWLWMFN